MSSSTLSKTSISLFLVLMLCLSVFASSYSSIIYRTARGQPSTESPIPRSFVNASPVVEDLLSRVQLYNNITGAPVTHYVVLQSTGLVETGVPVKGKYLTTVAYQDRFNRAESNNNYNIILQVIHTNNTILSIQGAELGGDTVSLSASNSSSIALPISAEIKIPSNGQSAPALLKTRAFINKNSEPAEVPSSISSFLSGLEIMGNSTFDISSTYALLQVTPDYFAKDVLGINNQYVATLAFGSGSRGTPTDNAAGIAGPNWNVFLQISFTNETVNSLRGIEFGPKDLQVLINGTSAGTLTSATMVPPEIGRKLGESGLSVGFGLFGVPVSLISGLSTVLQAHGLGSPDYATSFNQKLLQAYPRAMDKHLLFYTVSNVKSGLQDAIQQANANGGAQMGWSVAYDNEPSNGVLSTPASEYNGTTVDPSTGKPISLAAFYTNKAADAVHAASLKFGIAPSSSLYLGQKYPPVLNGIDWSKIDYWSVQINFGSVGPQTIIDTVREFVLPVKALHPNVAIYVAVNENPSGAANMTTSEVSAVVAAVSGQVDGIEFHRYSDSKTVGDMLTVAGR